MNQWVPQVQTEYSWQSGGTQPRVVSSLRGHKTNLNVHKMNKNMSFNKMMFFPTF